MKKYSLRDEILPWRLILCGPKHVEAAPISIIRFKLWNQDPGSPAKENMFLTKKTL